MADQLLAEAVKAKLVSEKDNIARLEAFPLKAIEKRRVNVIKNFAVGSKQRKRAPSKDDMLLLKQFLDFGAKAILSTGSMRAGDFLNNQLRGRWAEEVVLSMRLPTLRFAPFGPSGAAMPGHEDHRKIIATFREIEIVEGKRPDLLLYERSVWEGLTREELDAAGSWPNRLLRSEDVSLLTQSRCGAEVKNSTWHYGKRREHRATLDEEDPRCLSITVKDEELTKIIDWIRLSGRPVLFFQVLFDEIYCMSFNRMADGIKNQMVYEKGDYVRDGKTGAGKKVYHRFLLKDTRHRCAMVKFPDESKARVEVLASGSVIPYVQLQPAQAFDEVEEVISSELMFSETALRSGLPNLR